MTNPNLTLDTVFVITTRRSRIVHSCNEFQTPFLVTKGLLVEEKCQCGGTYLEVNKCMASHLFTTNIDSMKFIWCTSMHINRTKTSVLSSTFTWTTPIFKSVDNHDLIL